MQPGSKTKELKPLTAIIGLLLGGVAISGLVLIGTNSSLSSYIHLPTAKPETAQQVQAAAAKAALKAQACVNGVKKQWDPVIQYAGDENLPVATYKTQEQDLITKCQST